MYTPFLAQGNAWCLTGNLETIGPVPDAMRGQESDRFVRLDEEYKPGLVAVEEIAFDEWRRHKAQHQLPTTGEGQDDTGFGIG